MQSKNKIFFSAILGNILEYYDFTVYSIFAIVIGQTFFPACSSYLQNILSLGVFAVGFITRPIGGIIFGYIGDKYGRRIALISSMLGMTIPTFIIGIIPNFSSIGYLATFLLIVMRLIQGLCISGEGTGAAIFILEHSHSNRPGLITGIVHGSNIAGTLLASFIGIMIDRYLNIYTESWRLAFILGGLLGTVGFYLRLKVHETPVFNTMQLNKQLMKTSFFAIFKNFLPLIILTVIIGGCASSVVYMVKTYVNNFYSGIMNFNHSASLGYLSFASLIMMIFMPISGWLTDIFGKVKIVLISTSLLFVFALPIFRGMSTENYLHQIMALASLGILAGLISGTAYIIVISLFGPAERYTGVGFGYNLGVAILGGTAPIISRWLIEATNCLYAPAYYIMFTSGLLFSAIVLFMRAGYYNFRF